jgi:hypothetical protein
VVSVVVGAAPGVTGVAGATGDCTAAGAPAAGNGEAGNGGVGTGAIAGSLRRLPVGGVSCGGRAGKAWFDMITSTWRLRSMPASGRPTTRPNEPVAF